MGKNKSRHMEKTDWAVRTSAMRKVDNMLKKQLAIKAEGGRKRGRKSDSADND